MASASTINLYFQLLLLIGLTLGIIFAKKKKLVPHGWLMLVVFLLNVVSILIVMIPVAYNILSRFSVSSISIITIIHALLGVLVLFLSSRILLNWRFRSPAQSCYKFKGDMLRLYILWVAEVILGLALYFQLYL